MDDELKEARERFEAISRGGYYPKRLTPEEARERLRMSDPGIDISPLLGAGEKDQLKHAALLLLAEAANPQTLSYFSPILVEAIDGVLKLIEDRKRG
ncbi:hypothetical protein NNO_1924 [Hydrogenimonas sp.]|nr:hypothetical protein NNO_1924 [Hydrogenimonas sp.]